MPSYPPRGSSSRPSGPPSPRGAVPWIPEPRENRDKIDRYEGSARRESTDSRAGFGSGGGGGGGGGGGDFSDRGDRRGGPPAGRDGPGAGYGRRSRSPEWDDRRGKRRRSLSPRRGDDRPPPPRDGNRPPFREEREDFTYRDAPDPRSYPPPPRPSFDEGPRGGNDNRRPPMEPPASLPYLVTRRYLADYLRQTQPSFPVDSKDALEDAFRKYHNSFVRKSFAPFFGHMKQRVWFKERYDPAREFEELRKVTRAKGREGKLEKFLEEIDGGGLDDLTFDVTIDRKKAEGENGATNGTAVSEDTEMKPAVGSPAADVKTEEAKSEDVELPDVKLEVDVKVEADSKPFAEAFTQEIWPEDVKLGSSDSQLFIKALSPDVSRKELEAHCSQAPGFEYLALSEPNPLKKFNRVGWVQFKDAENIPEALRVLCESVVNNFTLHMQPSEKIVFAKSKLTPSVMSTPERVAKDLESIRLAAATFEKETLDTRGSEVIEARYDAGRDSGESGPDAPAALNKKTLDLYLHYLRTVFNTCYYCLSTHDFAEELERKCPKHLRRTMIPGAEQSKNISKKLADQAWVTKLDEKLPLLIDREAVDPRDFGGDSYEEELRRICHPKIKHEEEGKFRCKECNKLFSALKFIEKHISTKHPEILGDSLEQLKFFNNYVLDPSHPLAPHEQEPERNANNNNNNNGSMNNNGGMNRGGPMNDFGGQGGRSLNDRIGDRLDDSRGNKRRREEGPPRGPPPPPPPGAVMDPRARKGASSYADLDGTPAGVADVILPY